MLTHFPQAVPEIPVSHVEGPRRTDVEGPGASASTGATTTGGIGGISQGECRMFLTNTAFVPSPVENPVVSG